MADVASAPTAYRLGELSRSRLAGVHPDLVRVVERAIQITEVDFMVVEGVRSLARQKQLFNRGASSTMNSRHITGHAVDLCCFQHGDLVWTKPNSQQVADAMKQAADELSVPLVWGGDWTSFVDTPHFQLPWGDYPKQDTGWKNGQTPAMAKVEEPPKAEVKAAMRKSSKWQVSGWFKSLLAFFGVGVPASWEATKATIGVSTDVLSTVQGLLTSYGVLAFSGVCILLAIVLNWLQIKQADDYKDGRYVPSGDGE